MPKMKTHKGARKRVRTTASGKLKRNYAYSNHLATGKSPKRKRKLHGSTLVDATVMPRFRRLIPKI